jgi:hypothetical protein
VRGDAAPFSGQRAEPPAPIENDDVIVETVESEDDLPKSGSEAGSEADGGESEFEQQDQLPAEEPHESERTDYSKDRLRRMDKVNDSKCALHCRFVGKRRIAQTN